MCSGLRRLTKFRLLQMIEFDGLNALSQESPVLMIPIGKVKTPAVLVNFEHTGVE